MSVVVQTAGDNEFTPLLVSIRTDEAGTVVSPAVLRQQRRAEARANAARMAGALFWRIGALYGASAVALGAFGAHGLKKHITDPHRQANWATAAHYQLVHSVAILAVRNQPVAATFLTVGTTLFSGSLYALTLDPERFRWMGPVTPAGGLCLIIGWLSLVFTRGAALRL